MTEGNNTEQTTTPPTKDEPFVVDPDALVIRKLVPGIVVSLKCHLRGGRKTYRDNVRSTERADGVHVEEWDAKRVTEDPEEVKAGDRLRGEIHRKIKGLGLETAVGLIVPVARQKDLAITLANCHQKVAAFNAEANTLDVIYRYGLYESESSNKAAIAAINDQLDGILDQINQATLADDEQILSHATSADLGDDYKTTSQVLAAPADQRRVIVARVRAKLARKAIKEAQSFSSLLPEETGRAVDSLVKEIRSRAKGWVAASKEDEASYEKALQAVPIAGISAMQAALVMAATEADSAVKAATEAVAADGSTAQFILGTGDVEVEESETTPAPSSMIGALSMGSTSDE